MGRGEVWEVDLNPGEDAGHGRRGYVVVISSQAFNAAMPCALVVPVADDGRMRGREGFSVRLAGADAGTKGVALCDGIRAMDVAARDGRHVETLPVAVVTEITARIAAIIA